MDATEAPSANQPTEPLVELSEVARREIDDFRLSHETKVLTIFFSDLVGSTQLQVEQGNTLAARLVQRHYAIMRATLAQYDGREISTAGDSMLIVFAAPADAVKFAVQAEHAMRREQVREPLLPAMRCGIHQGQVVLQKEAGASDFTDIYGVQVSMAARIMSLGHSGQILLSRAVFDDARTILGHERLPGLDELQWANHGAYRFKGFHEDCDVCEVGEEGTATLVAPPASAKAWPTLGTDSPSSSRRATRYAIAAALLLVMAIGGVLIARLASHSEEAAPTGSVAALQRRLAEVDAQLAKLVGVDEELKAMGELDKKYQAATGVFFGNEPDQVRSESLQFLTRLRNYELNEAEQAIVAKADARAAQSFAFYPEEIYNDVRRLAESLVAKRKALKREQEQLQSEIARGVK